MKYDFYYRLTANGQQLAIFHFLYLFSTNFLHAPGDIPKAPFFLSRSLFVSAFHLTQARIPVRALEAAEVRRPRADGRLRYLLSNQPR